MTDTGWSELARYGCYCGVYLGDPSSRVERQRVEESRPTRRGSLTLPSCAEAFLPLCAPLLCAAAPPPSPSSVPKVRTCGKLALYQRSFRPLFLPQRRPIYVTLSSSLATCMPTYFFCRHDSSSSNLVATFLENHIKGDLKR